MTSNSVDATNPHARSQKKLAITTAAIVVFVATLMGLRTVFLQETPTDSPTPGDPEIAAIEAMVARGKAGVPELVDAAKPNNTNRRRLAFVGLGRVGPEARDALETIRGGFADPDLQTRTNALTAFFVINNDPESSVDELWQFLIDPIDSVRSTAADLLISIPHHSYPAFIRLLGDESLAVRRQSFLSLQVMLAVSPHRLYVLPNGGQIGWQRQFLPGCYLNEADIVAIKASIRQLLNDPDRRLRGEALFHLVGSHDSTLPETKQLLVEYGLTEEAAASCGFRRDIVEIAVTNRLFEFGDESIELLPDLLKILELPIHEGDFPPKKLIYDPPPASPRIRKVMTWQKPTANRIVNLLELLSHFGPRAKSAIDPLENCLDKLSNAQGVQVIATLNQIGADQDRLTAHLVEFLNNPATEEGRHGWGLFHQENDFRWFAGRLLVEINSTEAKKQAVILGRHLCNERGQVNLDILMSLWGLAPMAAEALPQLSEMPLDDDGPLTWHYKAILRDIGPAAEPILDQLSSPRPRNDGR